MDSSSEHENENISVDKSAIDRYKNLVDSESEEEESAKVSNEDDDEIVKSKHKKNLLSSSESEENETIQKVDRRKNSNPKKRDLTQKKPRVIFEKLR